MRSSNEQQQPGAGGEPSAFDGFPAINPKNPKQGKPAAKPEGQASHLSKKRPRSPLGKSKSR